MQHLVPPPPVRVADSKETQPSSATRPGRLPFIPSLYLQMLSGGRVDTELRKSACLRRGSDRSTCRLGDFFEVMGAVPVRTVRADGEHFSHVVYLRPCIAIHYPPPKVLSHQKYQEHLVLGSCGPRTKKFLPSMVVCIPATARKFQAEHANQADR